MSILCFTFRQVEGSNRTGILTGDSDGAELFLIAHDILLKCGQQALCVLWSQYHAALHLSLRQTGQRTCKVYDEIAARVRDDGEISILSLRHFLWQL